MQIFTFSSYFILKKIFFLLLDCLVIVAITITFSVYVSTFYLFFFFFGIFFHCNLNLMTIKMPIFQTVHRTSISQSLVVSVTFPCPSLFLIHQFYRYKKIRCRYYISFRWFFVVLFAVLYVVVFIVGVLHSLLNVSIVFN